VGRRNSFSYSAILGSGQLLLVGVAISALAFAELIIVNVPAERRTTKTIAVGVCVLATLFSALWFGSISIATQEKGKNVPDPVVISYGTMIMYAWVLISSAWCIALAATYGLSRTIHDTTESSQQVDAPEQDEENT
jgi:hypothetical protein